MSQYKRTQFKFLKLSSTTLALLEKWDKEALAEKQLQLPATAPAVPPTPSGLTFFAPYEGDCTTIACTTIACTPTATTVAGKKEKAAKPAPKCEDISAAMDKQINAQIARIPALISASSTAHSDSPKPPNCKQSRTQQSLKSHCNSRYHGHAPTPSAFTSPASTSGDSSPFSRQSRHKTRPLSLPDKLQSCRHCHANFTSKNRLFSHLRLLQHSRPPQPNASGSPRHLNQQWRRA